MSDAGERRFEPTPSHRKRARREGNVARSTELSGLAAFAAAACAAVVAVPFGARAAAAALRSGSSLAPLTTLAAAALAPAIAAACAATCAALAQSGGLHLTPVRLDARRLEPIAGIRRLLGADAWIALARAACALTAALCAVAGPIGDVVRSAHANGSPAAAASLAGSAFVRACAAAIAAGGAFAIVDYGLARRRWLRSLRMTLEELKRDSKENDGDPQSRARRKSAHRSLLRGGIGRAREASFVVVNPTHVAVALRYSPPAVPVPEILVRVAGDAALRVRALAEGLRIPVVENVALARLLFAQGESGRPIPFEAYVAVAEIVAALAREGVLT